MKKIFFLSLILLSITGCGAIVPYDVSYSNGGIVGYPDGFNNCYLNGGWNCDILDYGHGYYVRRRDRDNNIHPVFHEHQNNNPYPNWQPEWHPNPQPEWHQNFHPNWNSNGSHPNWRPENSNWHPDRSNWK